MKITVKVFAIIGIVLGGLTILDYLVNGDVSGFIGGAFFLTWGIFDLSYIKNN